jgi:hypothetical protein
MYISLHTYIKTKKISVLKRMQNKIRFVLIMDKSSPHLSRVEDAH